jgi:rod shape-determining protein MreC
MRNLLNFLARHNNLIIFLLLEGLSIYYLATRNNYHNARVMFAFRGITQGLQGRVYNAKTFFSLNDINTKLADENVALKNSIQKLKKEEKSTFYTVEDSVFRQKYTHMAAEVIDNSVNRQKNFFMINKGRIDGIKADMAVISPEGVAGVILGCSDHYSMVMSVLNIDFKVSARIKSNGYFGSLVWDGRNYHRAILNEIPQHVNINIGDTIETTGYSAVFPEGIMIGTISDFEKPGGDFYKISIELSTDFKKIHFVDIIGNIRKKEQLDLEKLFQ